MLTLIEKASIRDLLGVPMAGVPSGGHTAGYRFLGRVGQLEFYMNNLGVEEESVITGRPIGVIIASGDPSLGQTFVINTNGVPIPYTVTSTDMSNQYPRQSVLLNTINAINLANIGFWAGSSNSGDAQAGAQPLTAPPFGQIVITNKCTFDLTTSSTGANMRFFVSMNGDTYPRPAMAVKDPVTRQTTMVYGYINVCLQLRDDILNARNNLSLSSAGAKGDQGGAQFRPDELAQRVMLFRSYTRMLGDALYAGPDPSGRLGLSQSGRIKV
jgi:hypothetical protein